MSPENAASAFGAILQALSGVVSPALIDGAGWIRVREAVGELPVEPGVGFSFELRLGDPAAATDISVSLSPNSALVDHYVELGGRAPPGSPEAAFGQHLAMMESSAPWLAPLALEYDTSSGWRGGLPGFFARIRPGMEDAGAGGMPGAEAVAAWMGGAAGWHPADGDRAALARALAGAFGGLKAVGGAVDCVAVLPARPERAFRVISRSVEPSRALPLLEGLGWSGPTTDVGAFLSDFEGRFHSLRLAVGVAAAGVLPRVGLELFRDAPGQLNHPGAGGWQPCLTRLRDEGLCLPEKMDGLVDWPGREHVFCGQRTFGLLTGLAHLKISFEEGEGGVELEAKAYPYAGYLPFDEVVSRFGVGG